MNYTYYYSINYLPTRYEATCKDWENRRIVWDFKNGNFSYSLLNEMVDTINNEIVTGYKSDYIICFIPASTTLKTSTRYSYFASKIVERTGITASLTAITRMFDSDAGHITGKSNNPTSDFSFNANEFRGKKVILIDDVITRGRTFCDTASKLINGGALTVVGMFVAKTVNP
jgi:predicted amidophosphoribosyltransferase